VITKQMRRAEKDKKSVKNAVQNVLRKINYKCKSLCARLFVIKSGLLNVCGVTLECVHAFKKNTQTSFNNVSMR
jgi:hypothetical protein